MRRSRADGSNGSSRLFRTDSSNDIITVASAIPGPRRVSECRRDAAPGPRGQRRVPSPGRGLRLCRLQLYRCDLSVHRRIASPNNPSADADGNVQITPGQEHSRIPEHQFKARVDYAVTPAWTVGGNVVAVGSQYYVGDDANQNEKLPAYWVANLHTSYQVHKECSSSALVNNLFNKRYSSLRHLFRAGVRSPTRSPIRRPTRARRRRRSRCRSTPGLRVRLP